MLVCGRAIYINYNKDIYDPWIYRYVLLFRLVIKIALGAHSTVRVQYSTVSVPVQYCTVRISAQMEIWYFAMLSVISVISGRCSSGPAEHLYTAGIAILPIPRRVLNSRYNTVLTLRVQFVYIGTVCYTVLAYTQYCCASARI